MCVCFLQAALDDKLAAERSAVEALKAQVRAAAAAVDRDITVSCMQAGD